MFKFLLRKHQTLRYLSDKSSAEKSKLTLSSKPSNTPRPPKDPPDEGYAPESVEHPEIEISDFIRPEAYRQFCGPDEQLGPGAGKTKEFKNAHYFGYHRFSFVELQNLSLELRNERRMAGGVQVSTDEDQEEESAADSLEEIKEREMECEEQLAAQAKEAEIAKLKAWRESVEKKQEEMTKLKMSNNLGDEELKQWCAEREKKQQEKEAKAKMLQIKQKKQDSGNENAKRKIEQEKIKKTIDKRVTEILSECADRLTKIGEMVKETSAPNDLLKKKNDKALTDCKELVKKATDKAVLPSKEEMVKCEPPKIKKEGKKEEKGAETKAVPDDKKKEDTKTEKSAETKAKPDEKKKEDTKTEKSAEIKAKPDEKKKEDTKTEKSAEIKAKPDDKKKEDTKTEKSAETEAKPDVKKKLICAEPKKKEDKCAKPEEKDAKEKEDKCAKPEEKDDKCAEPKEEKEKCEKPKEKEDKCEKPKEDK